MKAKIQPDTDDLRPEYDFDFSQGERGRYYKRLLREGSNIVVLESDLAESFPDSAAVNKSSSIAPGVCSLVGRARPPFA
jgi:hypothetical protein